jgi:hypothetical protein
MLDSDCDNDEEIATISMAIPKTSRDYSHIVQCSK